MLHKFTLETPLVEVAQWIIHAILTIEYHPIYLCLNIIALEAPLIGVGG